MPTQAREFYTYLILVADDDGVAEMLQITYLLSPELDIVKILIAKNLITELAENVVYINDWKEHNMVQRDRYHVTKYNQLLIDKLGANSFCHFDLALKEMAQIKAKNAMYTDCIQDVSKMEHEVRLGKVRLDTTNVRSATADKETIIYEEINDDGERVVKRKGMKKPVTLRPTPFSYQEELKRLASSPAKAHKVAAHYFVEKGFKFENEDQYEPELARTLKTAKMLVGYSGGQIEKAMAYCKKEWPDIWTLETVAKRIAEVNLKWKKKHQSKISSASLE